MSTELILIRHGNAVRVNGGYRHAPLTPLGAQQAEQAGQHLRLEHQPLAGFYTSPLRRARETAAIIGLEIDQTPAVEMNVREMELMEAPALVVCEALSALDAVEDYLEVHVGRPLRWPLQGRVSKALTPILARHANQRVAVVAHGGVISSVLAWFFPDQRLHWWLTQVGNCSLTRLRIDGVHAELLGVNENYHLTSAAVTMQPSARSVNLVARVLRRGASSGRKGGWWRQP